MQTIKVFMVTPNGLVWTGYQIARKEVIIPFIRDLIGENPDKRFMIAECTEAVEIIDGRERQTTTITNIILTTEYNEVHLK